MVKDRETLRNLVETEQYDELRILVQEKKNRLSTLISLSYTADDPFRFRIIRATGCIVAALVQQDLDFVRTLISNLLWSLNDDSGSVGWSSPELLGEIISSRIDLFREYIPLVISLLGIRETYFRPGVLWAMGRIAAQEPSHIKPYAPYIDLYLADPVSETRAYAVWCLGQIQAPVPEEHLGHLLQDTAQVTLLDDTGRIATKTIAAMTREAAERSRQ